MKQNINAFFKRKDHKYLKQAWALWVMFSFLIFTILIFYPHSYIEMELTDKSKYSLTVHTAYLCSR